MNRFRLITLLVTAVLLIGGSYIWQASTQPSQPARTATIPLERTANNDGKSTDDLIALWQGRVDNAPQDYLSMTYLGQAYLQKGRETADASNYTKAEAALRQALTVNPQHTAATAFLGSALFAQHQFAEAHSLAEQVIAEDPDALLALALVGDAALELGDYDQAETAYIELVAQNQTAPVLGRMARLAWLQGDPETAVSLMSDAVEEASTVTLRGETIAWYQFQLGNLYFQQGDLTAAAEQYAAALEALPGYYLALAGQGKVQAAQGDLDGAIATYERVTTVAPLPEFIATLTKLYEMVGDKTAVQQQIETMQAIAALEAENGTLYDRQLALFYADHQINLDQALAMAEAELAARQDIYAYDTLAWVLYQNGRFAEAEAAMESALSLGTQDARLFYHAAMIQRALGNQTAAEAYLTQAQTINPYYLFQ